jgi:hypothetical protein
VSLILVPGQGVASDVPKSDLDLSPLEALLLANLCDGTDRKLPIEYESIEGALEGLRARGLVMRSSSLVAGLGAKISYDVNERGRRAWRAYQTKV